MRIYLWNKLSKEDRIQTMKEYFKNIMRNKLNVNIDRISFGKKVSYKYGVFILNNIRVSRRSPIIELLNDNQPTSLSDIKKCLFDGYDIVANIDVKKCRQFWWYKLNEIAPLVLTARKLIYNNTNEAKAILEKYYNTVKPRTASDRLGIRNNQFENYGPDAALMPWEKGDPVETEKIKKDGYLQENKSFGLNNVEFGSLFGPVPSIKIDSELKRLQNLIYSIKYNGYSRHNGKDGDIGGYLLYDDSSVNEKWCVRLDKKGNHRAAVLAAMGYSVTPVRILNNNLILRSEVNKWPQVIAGRLNIDKALVIFDNMIDGKIPFVYKWSPQ